MQDEPLMVALASREKMVTGRISLMVTLVLQAAIGRE
jgi:hypothetical protein